MRLLQKLKRRSLLDESSKAFVLHSRAKYPRAESGDDSVILLDFFFQHIVAYRYSVVANYLKKRTGAAIRHFYFHRGRFGFLVPHFAWNKIYSSFGSRPGLNFSWSKDQEREAQEFADRVFGSLKEKWDVVRISIDGIPIGDLIYDSFLREGFFTVDIRHERLRELICEAYLIFKATQKYLSSKKVKAFFPGHAVYIQFGIPVRLAVAMGVPTFIVRQYDCMIFRLSEETGYQRYPYMRFKEEFSRLSPQAQERGRQRAAQMIGERLAGKIDPGIADMMEKGRPGVSGYSGLMKERLLKDTGRPRILMMLNCFFDAPHSYRWMLFPDFWEWADFTLKKASETPYDWYVKPHPGGFPDNDLILEEFKKRYPKINFLGRGASNNQILHEGISAMFTVHGTAAHEFAYAGIPVVNAADNPHISFDFNLHPQTLVEYERAIENAGNLELKIDRSEVEAFIYMQYLHFLEQSGPLKDAEFERFLNENLGGDIESPKVFDYFLRQPQEKYNRIQQEYFEKFFAEAAMTLDP